MLMMSKEETVDVVPHYSITLRLQLILPVAYS